MHSDPFEQFEVFSFQTTRFIYMYVYIHVCIDVHNRNKLNQSKQVRNKPVEVSYNLTYYRKCI